MLRISRGVTVERCHSPVQQALNLRKLPNESQCRRNGIFGPQPMQAVRRFQARNHLTPDGIVGNLTRAASFPGGGNRAGSWIPAPLQSLDPPAPLRQPLAGTTDSWLRSSPAAQSWSLTLPTLGPGFGYQQILIRGCDCRSRRLLFRRRHCRASPSSASLRSPAWDIRQPGQTG